MWRAIRLPPLKIRPDPNSLPSSSSPAPTLPVNDEHSTPVHLENHTTSFETENDDSLVDCVLVFTEELNIQTGEDMEQLSTIGRLVQHFPVAPSYTESQKDIIRDKVQKHLKNHYQLDVQYSEVKELSYRYSIFKLCWPEKILKKTSYITIHAPLHVLLFTAERVRMKLPVEEIQRRRVNVSTQTSAEISQWNRFTNWISSLFDDRLSSAIYYPFYRTAVYSSANITQFMPFFNRRNRSKRDIKNTNHENFWQTAEKSYFTLSERHWLICELLARVNDVIKIEDLSMTTEQSSVSKTYKYFGIDQLISDGIYSSCYPLHEGLSFDEQPDDMITNRHKLSKCWASVSQCLKYQPLDIIRSYMGDRVAFYFAAIGFYTTALIPAAIIGLIAFIYGVASINSDKPTSDICETFGKTTDMCPLCDKTCRFWKLSDSCSYAQISYVFDNIATFVFAILMSIWARGFVELWKRHQSELQYKWDLIDFYECNEPMRPGFEKKDRPKRMNLRTGRDEPYLSHRKKIRKFLLSSCIVLTMIAIVCVTIFASIVYRIQLGYILTNSPVTSYSSIIITITTAVINLICSLILSYLYYIIARKLTDWESHKYQSDYESAFSVKVYIFEFVNFYSSLFYVAYFKGRTNGYPSTYGIRRTNDFNEQCDPAGCMVELSIQLLIIMIGKQAINNLFEYGIPAIRGAKCCKRKIKEQTKQWITDEQLNEFDWQMLLPEYLEMTIQFGFVTLFVTAFPLAPLFALLNNLVEVRLDAWKLLTKYRRPVLYKAGDIGVWTDILSIISYFAVLTNAAVIAWTSEFIPKLTYQLTQSAETNLDGYVNWTLSSFPINDYNQTGTMNPNVPFNLTHCRYRDFREAKGPDYEHTAVFWHVIAARLAFMIIFENVIYLSVYLLQLFVPDVSGQVQQGIDRQRYSEQKRRTPAPRTTSEVEKILEKVKTSMEFTENNQIKGASIYSDFGKDCYDEETNTIPDMINGI